MVGKTEMLFAGALLCFFFPVSAQTITWSNPNAPYLDSLLPTGQRVDDLMSRLTTQQKASLLNATMPEISGLVPPYDVGNEALHGICRPGKFTIFPMAIAMASMWDAPFHDTLATAISDEARARNNELKGVTPTYGGLLTFFSPTVNMARDPRWGRTSETYGEDPFLTGRLAISYVNGMQGNDPKYVKCGTTLKHYAANNQENNRTSYNAIIPGRILQEYYLAAYRAIIGEARPLAVMAAYNAINGVPCTANKFLLTDILRTGWAHSGYVVSDAGGVGLLSDAFHYTTNHTTAAAAALNAGCDLDLGDVYQTELYNARTSSLVTDSALNLALRRVLTARFRLGMFDDPSVVPYSALAPSVVGSAAHVTLARRVCQKSIILLKNDTINQVRILPLNKTSISKITVVGINAAVCQFGGYSCEAGPANTPVAPLDGIHNALNGTTAQVTYVAYPNDATQAATAADVVIAFMGTNTDLEGEGIDRTDIVLPADQTTYLQQIYKVNRKVVLVLINGGPLSTPWEKANIPAILEAWFPGEQGGNGIADVLFGDYNPAGRLPLTVYTGLSQLLSMADYDISNGRTYQYFTGQPLFPFGYGLSYTTFSYSNLTVSNTTIGPSCTTGVSFSVTNAGARDGEEVPQLYIHDNGTSVRRPIKQLKGFSRIALKQGQSKTVTFRLSYQDLAYYDTTTKNWAVNQGLFNIMVGSSSQDIRLTAQITADKNAVCNTGVDRGINETRGALFANKFKILSRSVIAVPVSFIGAGYVANLYNLQGRKLGSVAVEKQAKIKAPASVAWVNNVLIVRFEKE
jgi:beta-glucosidase